MEFCDGWFPRGRGFDDPKTEMARSSASPTRPGATRAPSRRRCSAPSRMPATSSSCRAAGLDRALFALPPEGRDNVMREIDRHTASSGDRPGGVTSRRRCAPPWLRFRDRIPGRVRHAPLDPPLRRPARRRARDRARYDGRGRRRDRRAGAGPEPQDRRDQGARQPARRRHRRVPVAAGEHHRQRPAVLGPGLGAGRGICQAPGRDARGRAGQPRDQGADPRDRRRRHLDRAARGHAAAPGGRQFRGLLALVPLLLRPRRQSQARRTPRASTI